MEFVEYLSLCRESSSLNTDVDIDGDTEVDMDRDTGADIGRDRDADIDGDTDIHTIQTHLRIKMLVRIDIHTWIQMSNRHTDTLTDTNTDTEKEIQTTDMPASTHPGTHISGRYKFKKCICTQFGI